METIRKQFEKELKNLDITEEEVISARIVHVYSLNPAGLRGIDPNGLEHFLVGD